MEAKIIKSESNKNYFCQWMESKNPKKVNFWVPLFKSDKSKARIYHDNLSLRIELRNLKAYYKKYSKDGIDRKLKTIKA